MKLISLIFFVFCFSICHAQDEALIKEIDMKCMRLGQQIKSFEDTTAPDHREGIGNGSAIGYYKRGQLQMIITEYFREGGKQHSEYYFDSSKLMFIYTEDTFYTGALQGKYEVSVWYFCKDKLQAWIKNDKQITNGSKEFLKSEMEQIKETKRLIRLLK